MTSSANKRSVTTLFSEKSDIYSHQVRIVLAEKAVPYEIENITPDAISEDLVLFNSRIIMEYLDERFPHPPLLPVYPVLRAKCRLTMFRIEQDWYSLIDIVNKDPASAQGKKALAQLREEILALAPVFDAMPYFMSEEFGLADCYIAPLLWRMINLGVEFTGPAAKPVKNYMNRVFKRDSFMQSVGGAAPKHLMDDKD